MKKFLGKVICGLIPFKSVRRRVKEWAGLRVPRVEREYYGSRKIYADEEAQDKVLEVLKRGNPCLIARFGGTEYSVFEQWLEIQSGKRKDYSDKIRHNIAEQAGFFPTKSDKMNLFAQKLAEVVGHADIMAVWFIRNEEQIMDRFCPQAEFIRLLSLEPILYQNPWSQYLKGKKVLVVHPFVKSIEQQYAKRHLLFENEKVLPDFELKTIKAVQSIADAKSHLPFADWFEALEHMKKQIAETDFDIAIIGAGAYGIFLADYCKQLGKQAIHLAGATQMLFGIMGQRWLENPNFQHIFNQYWVRPLEEEKPQGAEKVERGCYW